GAYATGTLAPTRWLSLSAPTVTCCRTHRFESFAAAGSSGSLRSSSRPLIRVGATEGPLLSYQLPPSNSSSVVARQYVGLLGALTVRTVVTFFGKWRPRKFEFQTYSTVTGFGGFV